MADASGGETMDERASEPLPEAMLIDWLRIPSDRRMGALFEAFRRGYSIEDVRDVSGGVTSGFLHRFEKMAAVETEIRAAGEMGLRPSEIPESEMRSWKGVGFTDLHIADAHNNSEEGLNIGNGSINFEKILPLLKDDSLTWIVETWQGHLNEGRGFASSLEQLSDMMI